MEYLLLANQFLLSHHSMLFLLVYLDYIVQNIYIELHKYLIEFESLEQIQLEHTIVFYYPHWK